MILENHLGAKYLGDSRCQFLVWAPFIQKVEEYLGKNEKLSEPGFPGLKDYRD